jgi:galactonate dehydratase
MLDYLVDPRPLTPQDGFLPRPAGPGLGIDVDEDRVSQGSVPWTLRDPTWRYPDGRIAEW